MKKITLTILMMVILGSASFGQYTASLQTITASPGENVAVNLTVNNFNSIGSFQFFIKIDVAVLTFQNITNFSQTGLMSYITGDTLRILWTNTTPYTWGNSTLMTLNFKYNGLTSPINFLPGACEVVKLVGFIPTILTGTFNNGAISPYLLNTQQAHIDMKASTTGQIVAVPLTYSGLAGTTAGSITQKISYDATKLTFISVTGTGLFSTGITHSASGGIITLVWTNPSGAQINNPGTQFNLNFLYIGSSTTNLNFSTGCVIGAAGTGANIAVTYFNGGVFPLNLATSFATLPTLNTAIQNHAIDVPITLSGMPAGTNNFNIRLTYDNPRMTFSSVTCAYPITSSSSGNTISIAYTNTGSPPPSINGAFLVLHFWYYGIGTAHVNFSGGCQFSIGSAPIQVAYTDGTVSPAPITGHNCHIGFISASSGSMASVPVTFTDMPTTIGSVTMIMTYDATKLNYLNATFSHAGTSVTKKGNVIYVSWTSSTPTNINTTPFVTLNFFYTAGSGSDCGASIVFNDGCAVSETPSGATVPVNWFDGGVDLKFKISGTLKYNSDPNLSGPLYGFKVYLETNPGIVKKDSVITNSSGYFEFFAANGDYKLDIVAPDTTVWYADMDDLQAMFNYVLGFDIPYSNDLRIRAGDVNQNGDIDIDDLDLVFNRILGFVLPSYTAPDWLFEQREFNVSCADVSYPVILGLNSGNVLGTNPTP